jgi:hypothetical protein
MHSRINTSTNCRQQNPRSSTLIWTPIKRVEFNVFPKDVSEKYPKNSDGDCGETTSIAGIFSNKQSTISRGDAPLTRLNSSRLAGLTIIVEASDTCPTPELFWSDGVIEISRGDLERLMQDGLSQKQIAKHFCVTTRTVRRRMRAVGLVREKKEAAASTVQATPWQLSRDPLLRMSLTPAQLSAGVAIRSGMMERSGLRGVDLIRMHASVGGAFDPNSVGWSDIAARDRKRVNRWIDACQRRGLDYRPALLVAGEAIPCNVAAARLGTGQRRTGTLCRKALDLFAELQGWHQITSRRPNYERYGENVPMSDA